MKNLYFIVFLILSLSVSAQVAVTTDGSAPDNSAMLDVKSTTKGFLPPRVALTAKNVATPVTSPATGLLVYNTATAGVAPNNVVSGYYYWNGTSWTFLFVPVGTNGQTLYNNNGSWATGSNLFNNGTNVGIGTTNPSVKLEVVGEVKTSGSSTHGFISDMNTAAASGYGGYFRHTSSGNASNGVYGEANYTGTGTGFWNAGGYFQSNSTTQDGQGVYGFAYTSNPSTYSQALGVNGFGKVDGTTGLTGGVVGAAYGGSVAYGIYGSANGATTNWAGYFNGNVYTNGTMTIHGGSPGSGKILTSDATGTASWQSAGSLLPAGTAGQTLRNDGTAWVANSVLSNNGTNIGIGTTSPQCKLDVAGNIALNSNVLRLRDGNDQGHGLVYQVAVDGPCLFGYNGGALGTAGMPNSLEWSWTGEVIAKNNFYTAKFITTDYDGINNGTFNSGIRFGNSSGEGIASNRTTPSNQYGLDFYSANNIRMSITNSGNVGIGTISPNAKLDIQGPAASGSPVLTSKANYTGTAEHAIAGNFESAILTGYGIGVKAIGGYKGVVGVSNSPSIDPTFGGDFSATGIGAGTRFGVYASASGSSSNNWAVFSQGNSYSTGSWQSSDARLKTEVRSIENAMDKILLLNPSTYLFKTDEYSFMNLPVEKQYGFLAQDLEQVFPEMVKEIQQPLRDGDGNTTLETFTFKGINYEQLIAVVVSALQEEHQTILTLKEEKQTVLALQETAVRQMKEKDELILKQAQQIEQLINRMDQLEKRFVDCSTPVPVRSN
jgi:hypothetical protein